MATPSFIKKTDFQKVGTGGSLLIDFGNYEDFDNFAYEIEQRYLTKLFGVYLRNIVGTLAGISWTDDGVTYHEVHGKAAMLRCFFYFHYFTEIEMSRKTSSDPGDAYMKAVDGTRAVFNQRMINAYNKGVDYFNEIVDYLNYQNSLDPTAYPNFSTAKMEYINSFGI
jgi:hypothetical protein